MTRRMAMTGNRFNIRATVQTRSLNPSKVAQLYLVSAASLSLFYLATPVISYLIFWEVLPRIRLTPFFVGLLVPILAARLLLLVEQLRFSAQESLWSFVLLVWISTLQALWYSVISTQVNPEDVLSTLALTLVVPWVLWLGGESLAILFTQKERVSWVLVPYLFLAGLLVYGMMIGFRMYGFVMLALQRSTSGEFYNYYIPLGDSLAMTGLLLMNGIKANRFYKRLGIYIFSMILLLFSFSRTSFLLFAVIGFVSLWIGSNKKQRRQFLLALLGTGGIILIMLLAGISIDIFENYLVGGYYLLGRVMDVFFGTDPSAQRRVELLKIGVESLRHHWLLGHFMGEAIEVGKGAYIHNWLSFWAAYGIGPFLLSLWCLLALLIKTWKRRSLLAFSLMAFTVLAILVARSYTWPYVWFAIGFSSSVSRLAVPSALEQEGRRL